MSGGNELVQRVISAVVFAALVIAGLLISDITAVVLVALLAGCCAFEFYRMMRKDGALPSEYIGVTAAALYPVAVIVNSGGRTLLISVTMMVMAAVLIWYVFSPRIRIADIALTLFGAVYCGLMLSMLVAIRISEPGLMGGLLAFGVVLSVWANDSFAYLFGSRFGRHKMAPKISPNKSWEGFFAGLAGSIIVWCLIPIFVTDLSYPWAIAGGVTCGVIAVFGDFAESRIKRGAGVKDSGKILPGHGGLLDRCDSLIFVSMAAFFVLVLAGVV